jgi:hypothetical protein
MPFRVGVVYKGSSSSTKGVFGTSALSQLSSCHYLLFLSPGWASSVVPTSYQKHLSAKQG